MTPRENFINFFKGKPYEKIPHSEDFLSFQPEEIVENLARGFVFQENRLPKTRYGGKDFFGVDWVFDASANGSMEGGNLFGELPDWRDYVVFPALDRLDWEGIAKKNRTYLKTDKLVRTTIFTGYFERLISFVGFEKASMALIDDEAEDDVRELFGRLTAFYIDLLQRMHQHFNVEYVQIHDDWGTQHSQMFSKATLQNMILPHLRRFVEAAHQMDCIVELHSCGQITPFVPDIIETGADTWCGQMQLVDKPALVRQYGAQFAFGIGIQPETDATEESVRTLVRELKAEYAGKRVWYFIASSHRPDLFRPIIEELESTAP